jgi:hypothetical protein
MKYLCLLIMLAAVAAEHASSPDLPACLAVGGCCLGFPDPSLCFMLVASLQ